MQRIVRLVVSVAVPVAAALTATAGGASADPLAIGKSLSECRHGDIRTQRVCLHSEHVAGRHPGRGQCRLRPAGGQRDGHCALCAPLRAGYVWGPEQPSGHPGRLLHRGRRPGPGSIGRRHQRWRDCQRQERQRCVGHLLAFRFQLDDPCRRDCGRLPYQQRDVGGFAGGPDAPGRCQGLHHLHAVLREPELCERRFRVRLAAGGRCAQRVAAAVLRPQQ